MEPSLSIAALLPADEKINVRSRQTATRLENTVGVLQITEEFLFGFLKPGREPDLILGACAKQLASIFKKNTGRDQWRWVGEILADKFPDALEEEDRGKPVDEILRNLYGWAYNLVKQFNSKLDDPKSRKKMIEQQRRDLVS